jgi:hypothetical protein
VTTEEIRLEELRTPSEIALIEMTEETQCAEPETRWVTRHGAMTKATPFAGQEIPSEIAPIVTTAEIRPGAQPTQSGTPFVARQVPTTAVAADARFSVWKHWATRSQLRGLEFPGVYVIAISDVHLNDKPFAWRRDIAYVGMTNAVGGLSARLRQFDLTISGKRVAHGGADRVRQTHSDYQRLLPRLYVATRPIKCNVTSGAVRDLLLMGRVAQFEFQCLARYVERFGRLPLFNDKARSPKYSAKEEAIVGS